MLDFGSGFSRIAHVMRIPRYWIKRGDTDQVFHVISRIAGREYLLNDEAKQALLTILRQHEQFSGCEVLTFCLMDNHFHLLLRVPERPKVIPAEDVLARLQHVTSSARMNQIRSIVEELGRLQDGTALEEYLNGFRRRMFDLSFFMKDMKQRFTQWYNSNFERKGTLWESRYKSVVVENSPPALKKVASYIDLNPVRAQITETPELYPWNGLYQLVKKRGSSLDRLARILGEDSGAAKSSRALWIRTYLDHLYAIIREDALRRELEAGQAVDRRGKPRNTGRMNSDHKYFQKAEDSSSDSDTFSSQSLSMRRNARLSDGIVFGSRAFLMDWKNRIARFINPL